MANRSVKTQPIHDEIVFRKKSGGRLNSTGISLTLYHQESRLLEGRLTIRVIYADYREIDEENLFHLTPDVRGPIFGGAFEPNQDVEIDLRLSPRIYPTFSEVDEAGDRIAHALKGQPVSSEDTTLQETESWFALYVKQDAPLPPGLEGSLKTGYRTTWEKDL